jgi:ribosomal protein L11 methylase PrmA
MNLVVGGIDFGNIFIYNERMAKAIDDKLFFLDFIEEANTILDFGCADGTLLSKISEIKKDLNLVGYDLDSEMIKMAKKKVKDAYFSTNWQDVLKKVNPEETIFNASSVIHEVYSYSTEEKIEEFWKNCFETGFKYITIRDMVIDNNCNRPSTKEDIEKCISKANPKMLKDFEKIHGPITNNKNLIHYLLKYRYEENWTREVAENYLPITKTEILSKIPTNYKLVLMQHYTLPFIKDVVMKDFGIELKDKTHLKLVLKKIN